MRISEWELWWRQSFDLTVASMKSRYRKTFAGVLWVVLNPIIMFGVQSIVFSKFLNLEIPDYYLFLAGGLIPWIFMSQTVLMGTPSLLQHSNLLRSFRMHPTILVTSSVLDNFFNFLLTLLIVILPVASFSKSGLNWNMVWMPVTLIPILLTTFSLTLFMALLNVFYRDTNFILGFTFSILFFLTPIFYPADFIPESYRWLIDFNPFYHALMPFRTIVYPSEAWAWFPYWLKAMGWSLGLLAAATIYWRKKINELFISL